MSDTPLGRFCWYELMTTDPGAARAFYTDVTGWTAKESDVGDMPYTEWQVGGASVGGLMELPEEARAAGAPPNWMAYVSTPDTEATLARVEELGGSAMWGPTDIPGVGRVAWFTDPWGAALALHEPAPGDSYVPVDPGTPGAFSWHELATDDWREARTFYHELLGWGDAGEHDMGPEMGIYYMFSDEGASTPEESVGGIFNRPDQMPVNAWTVYVRVEDITKALDTVSSGGGSVASGPMEVPGGDTVAVCVDPQGAVFALHQGMGG